MEFAIILLLIFLVIYEPVIGYFDYQKFKKNVKTHDQARRNYYLNSIIGLWIPTLYIFLIVVFTDLTFAEIGLTLPSINTEPLGAVVTYSVVGLACLYYVGILYYFIGYQVSSKIRASFMRAKEKEYEKTEFQEILPQTKEEKKLWNYVSLTAGVTEEVIYRGFLLFALPFLFPQLSIWLVILLASLLFGLAHTYQGWLIGVFRTMVFGVFFSILFIALGSILPLIVLHVLIDYVAKLGDTT
ncbi:CPBP family intramembrane glutamic endopeptidase [Halalkalibacter krulwichiae]|uniref:CAAX amino terminal protease self-immunity n=1 Tax=Halalkalibacter krulwichiae TaxID=199441 RepID=A0A1X9ML38_9BACI|nr:CPBP family intramembrane glutamic endopeptidase [Halalkalibacter krulwichiae]ARK32491.1 CAAX amino terminal protease self- immunity [Halalkalibacter krulwichiae]